MKKLICLFFLLFSSNFIFAQLDYQGDLTFSNSSSMSITVLIESESIVFEGCHDEQLLNNRIHVIQNGNTYRRYDGFNHNLFNEWQIAKNEFTVQGTNNPNNPVVNTMNMVGGNMNTNRKAYGYGKYLITITTSTNIVYKFHLNLLDSKYGDDVSENTYGNDFVVTFYGDNQPIGFSGNSFNEIYINPYNPALPYIPEFKVWELILSHNEPIETNFYIHTTPFGYIIRPESSYYISYRPECYIGPHVIFDGVYPNITNTEYGYNTMKWWFGSSDFRDYYDSPPIPSGQNSPGNTYVTPSIFISYIDVYSGTNFIAEEGSIFDLRANKYFWISSDLSADPNEPNLKGDKLTFRKNSNLIMGAGAKIQTCRMGKFVDEGSIKEFSSGNLLKAWGSTNNGWSYQSEIQFTGNNETHTINNGAGVEIDANATLTIGNNTTLRFTGSGTYLKLNPLAHVNFGENAKIEFTNGAYLDANGTTTNRITFSSLDASHPGTGLVFTNAGSQTSITYCTFNNLKTSVKIVNDGLSTANIFRNVSNNIINMNSYGQYGLHFYNVFRTNTQDNTITMTGSGGFGIVMRFTITTTHDDDPPFYAVNVLDNKVYNGAISAAFISTTSEYVPVNVSYNNFYYASYISAHGNHIGGDFKNNSIISSSNSCISMHLSQSTPNIYSNTLTSNYFNFNSIYSFQNMAPIQSDNAELIYLGGYNRITSNSDGNMLFSRGLAFLDYGQNCFEKVNNQAYKHLWGYVTIDEPTDPLLYYMRNNDFNGASYPDAELIDYETNSTVYPMTDGSTFTCIPSTDYGTIWQVRDMGNGIYDTIYYKTDNTGTQPTLDESLYNTAILKKISDYYFDAITIFKSLINNYPESSYTDASLFSLYECYEGMDTSSNQGITNALYGDLKTFLEGKINSELYSETFNCDAYQLIAMCETKMIDYENAMEAYEFISLYHPEPYIRLVASWDFAELEAIMLGGSGISSKEENMTDAEYKSKLISKINEIIKEDPIKKKVKKSYDKISAENNERIEKQVYSKTSDKNVAKQEIAKLKSADDKISNKTMNVLRYAKTMTKEERENRQIEDILYTPVEKVKNSDNAKNSSIPDAYSLSQNYPNPFNPVTKINYDLPKDGMVKLVVYDILGREVKTLVNEVKQAGRYTVEFNGSGFASGIYFYRIQTGNFVQVKRMVMIK